MVYVPGGDFLMGDADQSDNPRRTVNVPGFWIYRNLVTVKMYRAFCCRYTPRNAGSSWVGLARQPSDGECELGRMRKRTASGLGSVCPRKRSGRRRPVGQKDWKYPWGNVWDGSLCANSVKPNDLHSTVPVGSYPRGASPYGVLDMAGNAWQWCEDWYDNSNTQRVAAGWFLDTTTIRTSSVAPFASGTLRTTGTTTTGSGAFCVRTPNNALLFYSFTI